jgi:hypothetical protein
VLKENGGALLLPGVAVFLFLPYRKSTNARRSRAPVGSQSDPIPNPHVGSQIDPNPFARP